MDGIIEYTEAAEERVHPEQDPSKVAKRYRWEFVPRASEHFAIVAYPHAHPAGEGLFMWGYQLDHIPSGKRVFGGGFFPNTEEICELVAQALETAPVDWSLPQPEPVEGLSQFMGWAARRANDDVASTWAEWLKVVDETAAELQAALDAGDTGK